MDLLYVVHLVPSHYDQQKQEFLVQNYGGLHSFIKNIQVMWPL